MESQAHELLYSGAFGAGKSRIGCEKALFFSLKYPGNRGLITRKTFADLRATTMDTWFRLVCPEEHILSYNKQEHLLILKNRSEILFFGIDQASRVGSLEVGWIFADELTEFAEEDYNMLLGRIRLNTVPFRQLFGATNPSGPTHWAYRRFYADQELKRKGTTKVVESDSASNPFNPDDYTEGLNTLKGRYHDRYVKGLWVSFEGLVYDNWLPGRHILPRDTTQIGNTDFHLTGDPDNPIPNDWEIYRAIDFGFTNPFVCQWWASPRYRYIGDVGAQDRVEIPFEERPFIKFREIYYAGRTVPEHAQVIKGYLEKVQDTICDWSAGDREILHQEGIGTNKANKEVSAGIQTVYHMIGRNQVYMMEDSVLEPDPELEGASMPIKTEDEMYLYNRPKKQDGKPDPKEDPVKKHDHGLDAMRYLFHTLKILGGSGTVKLSKVGGSKGHSLSETEDQPEQHTPSARRQIVRGMKHTRTLYASRRTMRDRSWRRFGPGV